jgi:hypothetical protein
MSCTRAIRVRHGHSAQPGGNPELATFHEPHRGDALRVGTLRTYIRKLGLTNERFLELLE